MWPQTGTRNIMVGLQSVHQIAWEHDTRDYTSTIGRPPRFESPTIGGQVNDAEKIMQPVQSSTVPDQYGGTLKQKPNTAGKEVKLERKNTLEIRNKKNV